MWHSGKGKKVGKKKQITNCQELMVKEEPEHIWEDLEIFWGVVIFPTVLLEWL